jgi:DNA-directed RNA polymerase specialized sigma subunit
MGEFVLRSHSEVVRALLTYTDWWQPATTSILQVGAARRGTDPAQGFHAGLLDNLDERTELCRRMQRVEDRDRKVLFLWYVKQLAVKDIARAVGISRRQCFRRRAKAIRMVVEAGHPEA